jgi:hypothetical protein
MTTKCQDAPPIADLVADLRAKREAATPGPWRLDDRGSDVHGVFGRYSVEPRNTHPRAGKGGYGRALSGILQNSDPLCEPPSTPGADPALIVALVNAFPALADALVSLEAENARLRRERDRVERNRDMWKGQCERQAEQLRARLAQITGGEHGG